MVWRPSDNLPEIGSHSPKAYLPLFTPIFYFEAFEIYNKKCNKFKGVLAINLSGSLLTCCLLGVCSGSS